MSGAVGEADLVDVLVVLVQMGQSLEKGKFFGEGFGVGFVLAGFHSSMTI